VRHLLVESVARVHGIAGKRPLQYWQIKEYRVQHDKRWDEDVEPASVAEILAKTRKLGYPI
jgi:hypothetical protein